VVACDFLDAAAPQLVEARVADVTHDRAAFLDHDGGEHARHALPLGPARGDAMDLVVGSADRLADTAFDGACLSRKTLSEHRQRDVGGLPAGRLPTDAVDDDENPAGGVEIVTILVHVAMQTSIARAGGSERTQRVRQSRHRSSRVW
jgi:hypothetical protein